MTLLKTVRVFPGIKTEVEIRKKSVELKVTENQLEHENNVARTEIDRLKNEVILLEKSGRHAEALAKAHIAETKRKALEVSETKLIKCREIRAVMEAGVELTATYTKLADQLHKTMKTGNTEKTLEVKTRFDTTETMLDMQTEQVKNTLEIFDEGDATVVVDESAEEALTTIMTEHAETAPVIVTAAVEPAVVRSVIPAGEADVIGLEWKRQFRDEIRSAYGGR